MAEFRAQPPPPFNPVSSNFTNFSSWRQELEVYILATNHFANDVSLPIQQARLFNLAGPDFMKFANQHIEINANTTISDILEAIQTALKLQRFDLQNCQRFFECKQNPDISASKYLQELRELYALTNYPAAVPKETLIRDWFIAGTSSPDAKCLLFQQDSDTLTMEKCLHLVSSFELVSAEQGTPASTLSSVG